MFSFSQLDQFITAPKRLHVFLRDIGLLRPRHYLCDHCEQGKQGVLRLADDASRLDGVVYRCSKCTTRRSLRHGSIFFHSDQPLLLLCRVMACFHLHLTVTQTADLLSSTRTIVGDFFFHLRDAIYNYIMSHPIRFDEDEVVEVDELYLSKINYYDEVGESQLAHWIVGLVGRQSGRVYLDVVPDRDSNMMLSVTRACVDHGAVVISDECAAYTALDGEYQHKWCKK